MLPEFDIANGIPLFDTKSIQHFEDSAAEVTDTGSSLLMERAGASLFNHMQQQFPTVGHYHIVCGTGNNGGDGFVLARLARASGRSVSVYTYKDPKATDAVKAHQSMTAHGIATIPVTGFRPENGVIVDCIFGTGIRDAPRAPWIDCIKKINSLKTPVVSVDVPSGLVADTGHVPDVAVNADTTLTFLGHKPGLFTGHGPEHSGNIVLDDLRVTTQAEHATAHVITPRMLTGCLPRRPRTAHKGNYGHVLVIGGDEGFGGAALLAATAALRTGAGLVSIITHPVHTAGFISKQPELMVNGMHSPDDAPATARRLLDAADVVVIGPGMGQSDFGRSFFDWLVGQMKTVVPKLVFDADALNLLSQNPVKLRNSVLTPHPGEASRLLNIPTAEVNADRFTAVKRLSNSYGATALLKGAGSVIQSQEHLFVCTEGNPGMASGGMGDVLSGIVGGLMAQGLTPNRALIAGVWVHGVSADIAAAKVGEPGLVASDLFNELYGAMKALQ